MTTDPTHQAQQPSATDAQTDTPPAAPATLQGTPETPATDQTSGPEPSTQASPALTNQPATNLEPGQTPSQTAGQTPTQTTGQPPGQVPVGVTVPRPPALPSAPVMEPPRALVPGAFLRLEFEIKQVLSRGMTNLYLAQAGDYGAVTPRLIAERAAPVAPAPQAADPVAIDATVESPQAESAQAGTTQDIPLEGTNEEEMQGGAMLDEAIPEQLSAGDISSDEATATDATTTDEPLAAGGAPGGSVVGAASTQAEVVQTEAVADSPDADADSATNEVQEETSGPPQSPLFPPCEKFTQDEREYLVFDFVNSTALQDYREPTNDVRYLQVMQTLAQGLCELETKNQRATLTRDMLRFDDKGTLRYYGFVDPVPPGKTGAGAPGQTEVITQSSQDALAQLQEINSYLLKHVFAESSTMRLGDEFGSLILSDEVKEVARRLSEHEFQNVSQLLEYITALYHTDDEIQVEAALLSDVGRERELNEDSGMIVQLNRSAHLGSYKFDLYVVADGMGGHEGGEVASNLTLSSLQRNLAARSAIDWDDNVAVKQALMDIIQAVNADVVALTETPQYRSMRAKPGSTLTFALRLGTRVFVGNVGDSRAYKYNESIGLQRISKDHSYVQTLIDRGDITEEEAFEHPEGSIITAHIGDQRLRVRDVFLRLLAPGDKLLLVSDGVVDMLRDRDIAPYLQESNPATVCRNLVDASNAAGGADNITVVCVTLS